MQSARRTVWITVALAVILTVDMTLAEDAEVRTTAFHVEGMT